ncbi:MAG: glycosyltransferase [Elusimicrobia bacterium]|nr:glycosyltransferase [Elusimicrobiota bacterium]
MNEVARALLVYGYQPSGHSAAASAIAEAGRKAGLAFSSIEIAGDHHPGAGSAVARGYHALLRAAPGLYGAMYRGEWARTLLRAARSAYLGFGGARRLREGVRRSGAQAVVCPQAAVAAVLSAARARGELDIPVVSVLTDYGAHPFWADPPADLTLAPGPAAVEALAALGAPRARLRDTGIPISLAFSVLPSREEARRALALPLSAPVVLLSGGGKGLGGLDRAAAVLLAESPRARLLVLCGADDRLRASLSARREAGARLRAFGPQPSALVAAMMAASDLHLGKPGGLSSSESLAAGLPMVLTSPLPGQEEVNARHLRAAGAAIDGGSPERAARLAAALLHDGPVLARLRACAADAGRPGAAARAAGEIAALIGESAGRLRLAR